MEEELAIVIAAAMTYLGLPPERLDIPDIPIRNVVSVPRLPTSTQSRLAAGHVWKWSLSPVRKINPSQGKLTLKQRVSAWRQAVI